MTNKKSKGRTQERPSNRGTDTAPRIVSLQNEAIPKSVARVLNAQTIRDEFRKKRKLEDEGAGEAVKNRGKRRKTEKTRPKGQPSLRIQPGESLQHFNRRVEDDMRPLVKSAMQTARSIERQTAKQARQAQDAAKIQEKHKEDDVRTEKSGQTDTLADNDSGTSSPAPAALKEFATAESVSRRLNDVVQAPPEFKTLPRGASSVGKKGDVVSMSQRLLMEMEREKVILRYRELRASRRQTAETG